MVWGVSMDPTDTHFEDSLPTELKTVHRHILYCFFFIMNVKNFTIT